MILECIVGATLLATAAHLYRKKPASSLMSDFDRFVIFCNALPEEFRRQCPRGETEKVLFEAATRESTKASEIQVEQVLSGLLGQALGVRPSKISSPRTSFQEFVQTHPDRVLSLLEAQISKWTRLSGEGKAATLMMNLPPEVSAKIFQRLEPAEVQRIILRITQSTPIPSCLLDHWLQEFMGLESSDANTLNQATALAVRDSELFAKLLRERWLQA